MVIHIRTMLGAWQAFPTCEPVCLPIDVAASTTTAGASCAGGPASTNPTCDFACESGYEIIGASSTACGDNGECGGEKAWLGVGVEWRGSGVPGDPFPGEWTSMDDTDSKGRVRKEYE